MDDQRWKAGGNMRRDMINRPDTDSRPETTIHRQYNREGQIK